MANVWLDQAFGAEQVQKDGGLVRRALADVDKFASRADFRNAAAQLGSAFVFETNTQIVAVFGASEVQYFKPPIIRIAPN